MALLKNHGLNFKRLSVALKWPSCGCCNRSRTFARAEHGQRAGQLQQSGSDLVGTSKLPALGPIVAYLLHGND